MSEPSITDIAGFFGGLYALKCLKQGMDNGNLPKLTHKAIKYFGKLIIENPRFMLYGGFGVLGYNALPGNFEQNTLRGLSAMLAYELAGSGNMIVGTAAAAYLATLGIAWMGGLDVIKQIVGEMDGQERVRIEPPDPHLTCPEGYDLRWSILGGWVCTPLQPGLPSATPTPKEVE